MDAARLPGRTDADGNLGLLDARARAAWDRDLIAQGLRLLDRSATGTRLSEYHIEAAIAAEHAQAACTEDTNWARIVELYELLLTLRPGPVVTLNRAIALGQRDGAEAGLAAVRAIEQPERLAHYPFYFAALADFEARAGRPARAVAHFRAALGVARNPAERKFLEQRLEHELGAATSRPRSKPSPR